MPEINVTTDGTLPVIPARSGRTSGILQNVSDTDIEIRIGAPVSVSDPTKRGIILEKRPTGGTVGGSWTITKSNDDGGEVESPIYAVHGSAGTKIIRWEEFPIPS